MGNVFKGIWDKLKTKKDSRILILGLDGAGKTSVLYGVKLGHAVMTIPTLGFNMEQVEHGNISFTICDVGGQEKIRALWRHYYAGSSAVVFVVDSSDQDRLDDEYGFRNNVKTELDKVLEADELKDAALLVLANKQDLPHAMSTEHLVERLKLDELHDRPWMVQPCCAVTGEGLHEGFDWLADTLLSK